MHKQYCECPMTAEYIWNILWNGPRDLLKHTLFQPGALIVIFIVIAIVIDIDKTNHEDSSNYLQLDSLPFALPLFPPMRP